MRLGILASHPIQYQSPWFRELARRLDLEVFFAHRPTPDEQAIGFGAAFEWDVDLLSGYQHRFLKNRASAATTSGFFRSDTPEIAGEIQNGAFDAFIVSGWNVKSYWQAVRACRKARVPVLVRGDSQLMSDKRGGKHALKGLVYPAMLRQFAGFLSVGARNRQYLRRYRVPEHSIFFTPHFVDNGWFAVRAQEASSRRSFIRAAWGADEQTTVALFVGKFVPKKRPLDVLEGTYLARTSGKDVIPVFVGAGALESDLRCAAAHLGGAARFEGFKNQTELPAYYAAADVLVLPSDSGETWGLVVNEAMACGRPAVVSEAAGCGPDMIEHGRTGFTFPLANIAALRDRLVAICDMRAAEFDFETPIAQKLSTYSLERATEATIAAVTTVCARYAPN